MPHRTALDCRAAAQLLPLAACVFACAATILPVTAYAQSARLWSERGPTPAAMAQVPDFRTLAQQMIPAVASIQIEQRMRLPGGAAGDGHDFFHRYFGGEVPHNRGLGTGFVIDANHGLLLTNYHVVEDAASIEVSLPDADGEERKYSARVLGTAPDYDVALIQCDDKLQTAALAYLGNSDATEIGDWVMAVGNPFGLSHSVSVGIISAKERREVAPSGRRGLYNFLQTDASINPGNSGGPLVNMRGEVIGINSAINAAGSGIGFAIPINMVKEMLPDLKAKGRYARSWLGIKIQPLTPELAQSYGLKRTAGALVSDVVQGGPAANAKLREGDVILKFDGKDLRASSDLPLFASMAGVGKTVPLKVWREGKEMSVNVTLSGFPGGSDTSSTEGGEDGGPNAGGELGMVVADITPNLQDQLNLNVARGVVVKDTDAMGLAARAGLRPGDIVVSLNGKDVTTARQVAEAVRHAAAGEALRLKVNRQGATVFVALRKPG